MFFLLFYRFKFLHLFFHFFNFQDLVDRLNEVQLWALVYADIVNGELQDGVPIRDPGREPSPGPEPDHPDPGDSDHESDLGPSNKVSDWCNCQNCRPMPTHYKQINAAQELQDLV